MASSGRYQSRIFNFFHQQSRRITEQCDRALQQLKFATSSVASMVLYPLYLLLQSSQEAGKRLYQTVQQTLPQLPAADVDSDQNSTSADASIQQEANQAPRRFGGMSPIFPLYKGELEGVDRGELEGLKDDDKELSPPNHLPSKLIAWVKKGIAALNSNISQESSLVKSSHPLLVRSSASLSQALAFLDRSFAKFDASYLAPAPETALSQHIGSELKFSPVGIQQSRDAAQLKVPPADSPEARLQIQSLIRAAIDYFFGDRNRRVGILPAKNTGILPAKKAGILPTKKAGILPTKNTGILPTKKAGRMPTPHKMPTPHNGNKSNDLDPWLGADDLFGDISSHTPIHSGSIHAQGGKISNRVDTQSDQIEAKPDWIEARVKAVGYVKHPLELVLGWLDRAMLWLEEGLIKVLRWVAKLWQGK